MLKQVIGRRRQVKIVAFLIGLIFSFNLIQIAGAVEPGTADEAGDQELAGSVLVELEAGEQPDLEIEPDLEPADLGQEGEENPDKNTENENINNGGGDTGSGQNGEADSLGEELEFSDQVDPEAVRNTNQEKAFTLYEAGTKVGDYDSLKEITEKMKEYRDTNLNWYKQHDYHFVIEVNQDSEISENVQFGWAFGEVVIKSKDSTNPKTIKANNISHPTMISVVQGASVRIQDVIIDGNNTNRLFSVEAGTNDPNETTIDGEPYIPSELIIENGAVLQNGYAHKKENNSNHGGAIHAQRFAKITINGGEIKNNSATGNGGAICSLSWSPLTINGGKIYNNQAKWGGGIYIQGSTGQKCIANITGGEISTNIANRHGGGIFTAGESELTISGGKINENNTPSNGGGLYTAGNSEVTMTGGEISSNQAKYGGGILSDDSSQLTIKSGLISGNIATSSGGGAYIHGDNVYAAINGENGTAIFQGNLSANGGGIYNNSVNTIIKNAIFSENRGGQAGGIYLRKPAVLEQVELRSNQAKYGGGIYLNLDNASQKLSNFTLTDNSAAAMGGGIYIQKGSLEIEESSLSGNIADSKEFLKPEEQNDIQKRNGSGGGIYVDKAGGLSLTNTNLTGNKAYHGGGISTEAPITITNSTFSQNSAYNVDIPVEEGQPRPNKGHGGAIYVYKTLPEGAEIVIEKSSFANNEASESGGAISINETKGLVKISKQSSFVGNRADHGGAIYTNLHAYNPKYDDGSQGPIEPEPDPARYYINLQTDATTVFSGNRAFRTFTPPPNKSKFTQLLFQQTSHPGTNYDHILNNDDVNLIIFKKVIFYNNYQPTDTPIHQAYLFLEGDNWGETKFPADPVRPGYKFLAWNTEANPTAANQGEKITADNIKEKLKNIKEDTSYYAIWLKLPDPTETTSPIVNPIYLPTETTSSGSQETGAGPTATTGPTPRVKPSQVPATGESGQSRAFALALVLLGLGLVAVRLKSRS